MRSRELFALLACAAIAAACGRSDGESSASKTGADVAPAPVVASSDASPAAPLPPAGMVQAWRGDDALVSAFANQAMRGVILQLLAEKAGFELVLGADAGLEQTLTVRAEREPLEVVLGRVLVGVPHAVAFEKDPVSGVPHLARVTVGVAGEATALAAAPEPRPRHDKEPRPELTPEQRQERAEKASQLHATSLANLKSPDAEVRADAATWLDVHSAEGFQAAVQHLSTDESPVVRAAAAETLGESDVGAIQPLLQALNDPDSRVVLAALDALEFVGDETTAPLLAPLLKHRDVEVRERTVEAIEFLQ